METIQTKLPRIEDVMLLEGIELIDKGSYYVGLCPFHTDRSPSMVIYKTNNHFYCFGCGKSGDAIGFIMKYKNKSFHESLAYLNIKDYNNGYKAKKKRMIDIIVQEESDGVDVRDKYGSEFIDTLLAKEIVKLSTGDK